MPFVVLLFPSVLASAFDALGDHLHGGLERNLLPCFSVRPAIQDVLFTMRSGDELERRRPFRAEAAVRNRRTWIALNIDDLLIFDVHQLSAPHPAVRADGRDG